jgi:hypothetical protein
VLFQRAESSPRRAEILCDLYDRYLDESSSVPLLPVLARVDPGLVSQLTAAPACSEGVAGSLGSLAHSCSGESDTDSRSSAGTAAGTSISSSALAPSSQAMCELKDDVPEHLLSAIDRFLAEEPFAAFKAGPFYARFLQWKVRTLACAWAWACVCVNVTLSVWGHGGGVRTRLRHGASLSVFTTSSHAKSPSLPDLAGLQLGK